MTIRANKIDSNAELRTFNGSDVSLTKELSRYAFLCQIFVHIRNRRSGVVGEAILVHIEGRFV